MTMTDKESLKMAIMLTNEKHKELEIESVKLEELTDQVYKNLFSLIAEYYGRSVDDMLYEYYEQVKKYSVSRVRNNSEYYCIENIRVDTENSETLYINACDKDNCIFPDDIKELYDILEFKQPKFEYLDAGNLGRISTYVGHV